MTIDLAPIFPHLSDRRAAQLINATVDLEAAVAAGLVPNTLFTEAKDVFNRATDESVEAFLKTGPHKHGHTQSDWWLGAYDVDALVNGLHGLPAALKRATPKHEFTSRRSDLVEYRAFLASLLPLRELLAAAKPLVKKRGELPVQRTAQQIADDADRMTCQCCGRRILANTGKIANHGYERPEAHYQTASCGGAQVAPFEVSRDRLGRMIRSLIALKSQWQNARDLVAIERAPIVREYTKGFGKAQTKHKVSFTRASWDSPEAEAARAALRSSTFADFDALLKVELASRDNDIRSLDRDIAHHQARYDGWKQTHSWEAAGKAWVAL